jgi:hypothetical protein
MRIEIVGDGHIFQGTAKQIVAQMHSLAFAAQHLSLREYIDWNVAKIERGFEVKLTVTGETDEERAKSFLDEMIGRGYAREI